MSTHPVRNLLTSVSPCIDVVIIIPYAKKMIIILSQINLKRCCETVAGSAQEESIVLNEPIIIAVGCADTMCAHQVTL